MGEYWKAVNVDKREQVHPHRVGDGLKWYEWVMERSTDDADDVPTDSKTRRRILSLIAEGRWAGDEIRAVSDYGGSEPLYGQPTERPAGYDDEWIDVSRETSDHE